MRIARGSTNGTSSPSTAAWSSTLRSKTSKSLRRYAEEALRPWRDKVSIVVRVRFDQTKVIPDVPATDVTIEGPTLVLPVTTSSSGIYTRTGDQSWLVGGLIEAVFDVREVSQATLPVVMGWNGKEIARVAVDFAALE
jgi:hypothetical protein